MAEEEEETPLLLPCSICSRTFIPASLEKHRKICEKTASKKRGVFNSFKQRLQGTGLEEFLPLSQINLNSPLNRSESKWRQKHLDFVRSVREARGLSDVCNETKRCTPSSFRRASNTGNETCPYCQRNFCLKAFDRHLEWCKEQKARIPKNTPSSQAKERLEARTKYRAPLLSKSKRVTTKEKYSSVNNAAKSKSPAACNSKININRNLGISTIKDDNRTQGLKPHRNKESRSLPATGKKRVPTATIHHAASPSGKISLTKGSAVEQNPPVNKEKKCNISEWQSPSLQGTGKSPFGNLNTKNGKNINSQNIVNPEVYDPFVSAERQMKELMGPEEQWESKEQEEVQKQENEQYSNEIISSAMYPLNSNKLCTSPASAFAKYSFSKSDDELESYLKGLQDNESTYLKSEEESPYSVSLQKVSLAVLSPKHVDQAYGKEQNFKEFNTFPNFQNISLVNLDSNFEKERIIMIENDACSEEDTFDGSFDFSSFPFDMENFENEIERIAGKPKKSTKYRAKLENAALALQQSVSLYHPGPAAKPGDFPPSSESEDESSSHLFQKTSLVHSLTGFHSPNSQKISNTMSGNVKLENEKDGNTVKTDGTENKMCCIINNRETVPYTTGSKISGDSAYSSLNRKSPPAEIVQQVFEIFHEVPMDLHDKCESSFLTLAELKHESECPAISPSQPLSSSEISTLSKLSNFCHNCGLKYPVASAKFCCECGIKRLCI